MSKWLRLQRSEDAAAGYDAVRGLYNRRIFPTIDGVRNTLRILDRVDPKFGRMKVETLVDERIVRKLEREGFSNDPGERRDFEHFHRIGCSYSRVCAQCP